MQFFEVAGNVIVEIVRWLACLVLTVPLMLTTVLGEAVDIFVGVKEAVPGKRIYDVVDYGEPPPVEYGGYICFDFDSMFPGEYKKFYDYYTLYDSITAGLYPFQSPFQDMNNTHKEQIEKLWNHIPAAFRDGKSMRNYVENYLSAAYSDDPAIIDFDNNIIRPVSHTMNDERYYYIPGDEASRAGMYTTPGEAVAAHMRGIFHSKGYFIQVLPYIDDNKPNEDLGPPISLVTQAQARSMASVRYYAYESRVSAWQGLRTQYQFDNDMNHWMIARGYPHFFAGGPTNNYPMNAVFKYHMVNSDTWEHNHTFSIRLFYPVKPLWRAFIDHSPEYTADITLPVADMNRYTPEFQAWMKERGINPGTPARAGGKSGAEVMYEKIAEYINEGRDLEPVSHIGDGSYIIQLFWNNSAINYTFWGITLMALVLCMGFSIFAVIRSMGDSEQKRPLGKVMGSVGKAHLQFLLVPVIMIIAVNLTGVVIKQASYLLDEASGAGDVGFSSAIAASALTEDSIRVPITGSKALDLEIYRTKVASGEIHFMSFDFPRHFDPLKMYIIPTVITAMFCVVMMAMMLLIFIRRIMEVTLLYLVSPFVVATIPLDDGAKFKTWRETFIAKILAGFSSLIMLKLFLLLLPVLWSSEYRLSASDAYDMILRLMITAGGMYTAYASQTLLSNVLHAQTAGDEKESASFMNQQTVMRGIGTVKKGFRTLKSEAAEFKRIYSEPNRNANKNEI